MNYISENAFHFRKEFHQKLTIDLRHNKLNQSSFALNSFSNIKTSVKLDLRNNQIEYLN